MSDNPKLDARLAEMQNAIPKLKKENREIALLLCRIFKGEGGWRLAKHRKERIEYLLKKGKTRLDELFSGSRAELLPFVLGKENAKTYEKILGRLSRYPYQEGNLRSRSFRTKENAFLLFENAFDMFEAFFEASVRGCTLQTFFEHYVFVPQADAHAGYFDSKKPDKYSPEAEAWRRFSEKSQFASQTIALALDEKDEFVTRRIREIVYGDASSGILHTAIIAGALKSRSAEAHKMIGDLLLAAKLQEGLRQIILECADEASLEGFRYVLRLVLENNLERFSSVVRSFGTWTGLNLAEARPKTIRKALEIVDAVVGNPKVAEKMLDTDDLIELYVALWGVGLNEVGDARGPLVKLVRSDRKYKRLAGLYFLKQLDAPALEKEIVLDLLKETDLEVWESLRWRIGNILDHEISVREIESGLTLRIDEKDEDEDEDEDDKPESDEDLTIPKTVGADAAGLKDAEIRRFFQKLLELAEKTPKAEARFEPDPYCDYIRKIGAGDFISTAISAAVLLGRKDEDIDRLAALLPKMGQNAKSDFLRCALTMRNPKHRPLVLALFADPHVNRYGMQYKFAGVDLTSTEYEGIEAALRLKSAEIRLEAIQLLLGRSPEGLQESIERLLDSKDEQKRLAGLDLIGQAEKIAKTKKEYAAVATACKKVVAASVGSKKETGAKKSAAEEILLRKIAEKDAAQQYSRENGYGFCDPNGKIEFPAPKNSKRSIREFLLSGIEPYKKLLHELSDLVHKHREAEYEGYAGYNEERKTCILGSEGHLCWLTSEEDRKKRGNEEIGLDDLPLAGVWNQWIATKKLKPEDFLRLEFFLEKCSEDWDFEYNVELDMDYKPAEWFIKWYCDRCCPAKELKPLTAFFGKLKYRNTVRAILGVFISEKIKQTSGLLAELLGNLYHSLPEGKFTETAARNPYPYGGNDALTPLDVGHGFFDFFFDNYKKTEPDFERKFSLLYKFYATSGFKYGQLDVADFEKARSLNMIDDAELYREMLCRNARGSYISEASNNDKTELAKIPNIVRLYPPIMDRLIDIELKRGDTPTEVSDLVSSIRTIEGIEYFARVLHALGEEPFTRGYSYGTKSRKDALCSLLKKCRPSPAETTFGKTTALKSFPEQRLLEAAMYVPEWIDIVQQYLGWKGLTSACWYFHAHINESMSETKESVIARYSPITPQRFQDGAFDIDWFNDAHATLGDKRFQMVYDAAKYITSGGNHRRAQIFADALRGKLKIEELRKSIVDKRNKDNLLAYSLLPLKKGKPGEKEQLERYAFLQNFLKESKKFGQQRKESEGKICEIALENLARAAGYEDANRFIWAMETEKSKEYAKYFVPIRIDGFELSIAVDAFGKPTIRSLKEDGTELKDVPTKLKKHAYVEELKEAVKIFRDQFRSVRENFEKAMGHETEFTVDELSNLSQNPVIKPIIGKLVYGFGKSFGFFADGELKNVDGKESVKKLKPTDRLTIAHPSHLYEAKVWKPFQKIVFEREIVQPFKQVFRELYLPNADEKKAKTCSRRYAGHQVQPGKTVALLKSRGWTIDPALGFQKVFYTLDVLIRLYCYADWFMPSEIEAPTIEQIEFVDRKTLGTIPLDKIPSVVFSEIMRDLDLVVAVAHVGGVDPEASLSTVEMRAAIMEETLKLMKLKNVSMKKTHAMIKGTLGEYTVHLGSGEVQMMAGGSLTILPVHSQQRGRLFLPFIDDDPKTAEIMSKTILLAEDEKIKDPTILAAISG